MAYPVLTANSPTAGQIAWSAFSIAYKGVTYSVAGGSTALAWVAWLYNSGVPQIATNNVKPTVSSTTNGTVAGWTGATPSLGPDDLLLFGNRAGVPLDVQRTQIITGDLIATGTIVSSNIATNTITATNILAGTITGNEIAANTITGTNIQGSTITGTKIAGNTITGDKIQAGSITTANLTVGNLAGNQVLNGNFEDTDVSTNALLVWRANFLSGSSGTSSNTRLAGGTVLDGAVSGVLGPTGSLSADLTSNAFTVTPGQTYYVSAVFQKTAATIPLSLVVTFGAAQNYTSGSLVAGVPTVTNPQVLDTAGVVQTGVTSTTSAGTAYAVNGWNGGAANTTYTLSGQVKAPTGAKWASVSLVGGAGVSGSVYVDDAQCDAVIISAYIGNGAIDGRTITGALIRTAASGTRVEMGTTGVSDRINFYSSTGSPGYIGTVNTGNELDLFVMGPFYSGHSQPYMQITDSQVSGTTTILLQAGTVSIGSVIDVTNSGAVFSNSAVPNITGQNLGSTGARWVGWFSDIGTNGVFTHSGTTASFTGSGVFTLSPGAGFKYTTGGALAQPVAGGNSYLVMNTNQQVGVYTPSSSRRLKQDITDETVSIEDINQLQIKSYRMIAEVEESENARTYLGMIAEDVHEIPGMRWMVSYTEDGVPVGLDYERLAVGLVPVVQDLYKRLTALEAGDGNGSTGISE